MTKVLVVDDDRDGADGLAMYFGSLGHQTATAYSGVEALEISDHFHPDFVILDIEMPLMNGFQTARAFRSRSPVLKLFLVALSGLIGIDVESHTEDCGFDFYMKKPADLEKLRAIVEQA